MSELLASPTAGFAMFGTLAVILGGLYTRHIKLTTRTLIDIALMLALTIVLHQIRIFHMPQGGSVTLGAMVPLLLLSYRYGPGIGALAGYAPEGMNPLVYSLAFNATYLIPEFLICCLILRLLPVKRLLAAMGQSR